MTKVLNPASNCLEDKKKNYDTAKKSSSYQKAFLLHKNKEETNGPITRLTKPRTDC